MFFSIDQNCHSLWDALPKVQALAGRDERVRHFLEDVDVAFTALGAGPDTPLRLAKERFYRSGGQDWGAALFYSEFLGRVPVEIRHWEPLTGMTTKALAGRLRRKVDELYGQYSPGDNWQLIGPSYVGDKEHHRVIGDLSVEETAGFLRQMMDTAERDLNERFIDESARKRLAGWFSGERALMERLIAAVGEGPLVELYRRWMTEHVDDRVTLDLTSNLFAIDAYSNRLKLLEWFCGDYSTAVGLYNDAIEQSGVDVHKLDAERGELPFFAVLTHEGRLVRCEVFLNGSDLCVGERTFKLTGEGRFPVEQMQSAGVRCLAGKAVLLTIQARLEPGGAPLAVPHRGSPYMPASHELARKLTEAGALGGKVHPVARVRFRLLDRMAGLDTRIRLPAHLARAMGSEEVSADELSQAWASLSDEAQKRLEEFRTDQGRRRWQQEELPELLQELDELDSRRRELARKDPKCPEIREASKRSKELETQLLERTLQRIDDDWQLAALDTWDSRGAIMPICIALGGQEFYRRVLAEAEVYDES
ncbi:MAG: hypothetical protein ACP5HU_08910 [Phycisphaerae bacterium]